MIFQGTFPRIPPEPAPLGRQVTVEYHNCSKAVLSSRDRVEQAMVKAARDSGSTVVSSCFHKFEPQGVSGVVIIAESHLTVHAWPEHDYAAVDIFTCGGHQIFDQAVDSLACSFESKRVIISSDQARGVMETESAVPPEPEKNSGQGVEIRFLQTAPLEALVHLYRGAGWWEDEQTDPGFLYDLVKGSALFAGAYENGELVGMGRALSDSVSDAYIQDVTVLKSHRGRGIGEKIILALIRGLRDKGVDWIGLIAEPGTFAFYQKFGFYKMEGHIPLKLHVGVFAQKEKARCTQEAAN